MKPMPQRSTQSLQSPLGPITLAATAQGLCGVWFEGQRHGPSDAQVQSWDVDNAHPVLQAAALQLHAFFAGQVQQFELPLDLSAGTPFQQAVWLALMRIPHGQTCTYGQLAQSIGKANASRAVGTAVGRNPISVLIPCHRVIGSQGQMTGYAGGLARKTALLQIEGALPAPGRDSRPKPA